MVGDAAVFFAMWLRKPLRIAAICPSGAPVAAAMARLVDPGRPGPLLELGAGTGSLTRGLVAAGWPPGRIIACEREARLVDILRREFPGIRTMVADATGADSQLRRLGVDRLSAVVSSLPIKWFPREAQRAVLQACFERLGPAGYFLQLTNAFTSPLSVEQLGITGQEVVRVWRNVPPVQIWSYSPRAGGP
ncbi:MAG TPA: methyltransferase domain-containing protein [Stellaceae bacterium]|jgi:phosphatidylethanolamine/phosphatidyl-N-methylethanolamine N-methyltransferase|nr:methyltransferase domain-containing protein [Stellaceae bacterium]